ncbi:MAG: prepilin-type N-terminal cleavage/methylation domain-containing protein [Candidatus Bruticola sp.]
MKLKFKRKGQRGLTLLEILVAIAILTSTLIAFASVFPAAFKLNRQSQNSVKAAKHAAAIAEELRSMPIACNPNLYGSFSSRASKHYLEQYSYNQATANFDNTYDGLTAVKELKKDGKKTGDTQGIFTLDAAKVGYSSGKTPKDTYGVYFIHNGKGDNNDSRFWEIYVNVFWNETINGKKVARSASVVSARTGNR